VRDLVLDFLIRATIEYGWGHGVEQAFMPALKDRQTSASAAEVKKSKEFYEVVYPFVILVKNVLVKNVIVKNVIVKNVILSPVYSDAFSSASE
jgi:hypothetical protein